MPCKQPEKWKDTIDPFELNTKKVKITEILGYPYAANQVFYIKGIYKGKEGYFFLKYAGHVDANIKNEVKNIAQIKMQAVPTVIEYDKNYTYLITSEIEGERLSKTVNDNGLSDALPFMFEYGKTLAELHSVKGDFADASKRRFHTIADKDLFLKYGIEDVYRYLIENKPLNVDKCFVHGDFHYANILWYENHISGILDFELSGIGNREFDIAWALILRPEQRFMKTDEEFKEFIKGYTYVHDCEVKSVIYYMCLIYSRFIALGDGEYREYVKKWLKNHIN